MVRKFHHENILFYFLFFIKFYLRGIVRSKYNNRRYKNRNYKQWQTIRSREISVRSQFSDISTWQENIRFVYGHVDIESLCVDRRSLYRNSKAKKYKSNEIIILCYRINDNYISLILFHKGISQSTFASKTSKSPSNTSTS